MAWPFSTSAPALPSSVSQTRPATGEPSIQSLGAFGVFLVESVVALAIGIIALAFGNIPIIGAPAKQYLQGWATALETQANNALATANGAQTTATAAQSTATTAATTATQANATATTTQNNLGTLIDGLISGLTGSNAVGNDITAVANALFYPLAALDNALNSLGSVAQGISGDVSSAFGRLQALENNVANLLAGNSTTPTSGYDGCLSVSNFTNVAGMPTPLAIAPFSGIQTGRMSAGYYNQSPATDKQGVKIKLLNKQPGICRAVLCADTAFTNYVALEIYAGSYNNDSARIVTGSSPTVVVPQAVWNDQIDYLWTFDIKYDPATKTYYVYKNTDAQPILTWIDSNSLITHGSAKRHVGVMSNCGDTGYPVGFGIGGFTYYDWTT